MCEGEGDISASLRTTHNSSRSKNIPWSRSLEVLAYNLTYSQNAYYLYVGGDDVPMFVYFKYSSTLWAKTIHSPAIKKWFLKFINAPDKHHIYICDMAHPWATNYIKRLYE